MNNLCFGHLFGQRLVKQADLLPQRLHARLRHPWGVPHFPDDGWQQSNDMSMTSCLHVRLSQVAGKKNWPVLFQVFPNRPVALPFIEQPINVELGFSQTLRRRHGSMDENWGHAQVYPIETSRFGPKSYIPMCVVIQPFWPKFKSSNDMIYVHDYMSCSCALARRRDPNPGLRCRPYQRWRQNHCSIRESRALSVHGYTHVCVNSLNSWPIVYSIYCISVQIVSLYN